jgi:drug/metabolite transporter (DMT)-like permease
LKPKEILLLVMLGALWGVGFLFIRVSVPEFGIAAVVEIRLIVAFLFLLPFLIYYRQIPDLIQHWRGICVVSILSTAIPYTLFGYTLAHATASYSAMLNITVVFFTAAIAWIWLGERISKWGIVGIMIGAIGVLILITDKSSLAPGASLLPSIAALIAASLYGFGTCYLREKLKHAGIYAIATGCQLFSIPVLLPFTIIAWPEQPPSFLAWLYIISLGIFSTGIAFVIYFHLVKTIGATKSSLVTYLVPLFAIIWGVLLLDEPITLQIVLGGTVILFGVSMTSGIWNRLFK